MLYRLRHFLRYRPVCYFNYFVICAASGPQTTPHGNGYSLFGDKSVTPKNHPRKITTPSRWDNNDNNALTLSVGFRSRRQRLYVVAPTYVAAAYISPGLPPTNAN